MNLNSFFILTKGNAVSLNGREIIKKTFAFVTLRVLTTSTNINPRNRKISLFLCSY